MPWSPRAGREQGGQCSQPLCPCPSSCSHADGAAPKQLNPHNSHLQHLPTVASWLRGGWPPASVVATAGLPFGQAREGTGQLQG